MNDELVNQRYTLRISEVCLDLVFLRHVIQKFEYQSSEARCLQDLNQLWYHTLLIDLVSDFRIEGQVEEQTQGDLEKQLVVAWNEAVQLLNDSAFLHFCLVLTEDTQFLEEVQNDEEKIWVVSVKH